MWKKIGIWLAFMAMLLCMSVSVYAQGGNMAREGTAVNPYQIEDAADLQFFCEQVNAGNTGVCAILTDDITLNEGVLTAEGSLNEGQKDSFTQWTPIGTETNGYTGTFDGNGKTIFGLYINDSNADHVGFFGYIGSDAEIKDLSIGDSYISGNDYAGGVCGYNVGTITNCSNTGAVSGVGSVGGVCGYNNGSIADCYNTGGVGGTGNAAGGVCGYNSGTITNCYNSGTVSGNNYIGGVCGGNATLGTIENCYNIGEVSGNDYIGGVCGGNAALGTIENCYNSGTVSNKNYGGGVCGFNFGGIANSYNIGIVNGSSYVGGVCGWNNGNPATNCYFLSGTAESGIGYGGIDTDEAIEKAAAAFASGEVTWLLDKEQAQWEQQLGADQLPRLVMAADGQEYDVVAVTITLPDQTFQIIYTNADQILQNYPQPASKDKAYEFYEEDTYVTKIDTAEKVYTADMVIYAKEVDVKAEDTPSSSGTTTHRYDLTFNTNGGKLMASVEKRENVTIDLSQYIPVREGYVFVGWYLDKALTQPVSSLKLSRNTTLYAKWEKSSETTAPITIFADVQAGDWFYNAVNYAVEHGLMSGTGEGMFQPDKAFTREMLAVVLWNLEEQPQSVGQNTFTDVADGMWYTKAVTWAKEEGVVAGFGENFGVGMPITREQFAVMLYNYAQYQGYDVSVGENTNILSYPDALSISDYAYPAMQWVCGASVMAGDDLNRLNPQGQTSRAEAAQMLMNFCENVVE